MKNPQKETPRTPLEKGGVRHFESATVHESIRADYHYRKVRWLVRSSGGFGWGSVAGRKLYSHFSHRGWGVAPCSWTWRPSLGRFRLTRTIR